MRSRRAAFHRFASTFVLALTLASTARADEGPAAARADDLFREGRAALKRGDYQAACARFRESLTLDAAAGTLLNLSDCEDHLGELTAAIEHSRAAIDRLAPDDERMPLAREHAALLKKRMPHLTLNLAVDAPAGTHVSVDQIDLGTEGFGAPFAIDPGEHAIAVGAPGRPVRRFTVSITEASATTMTVTPAPAVLSSQPTYRVPGARPGGNANPDILDQKSIALAVGAGGAVATSIGIVLALLAKSHYDESAAYCSNDVCTADGVNIASEARNQGDVATFVTGVGLIALATGTALWLTAPPVARDRGSKLGRLPTIDVGPSGVAARAAW